MRRFTPQELAAIVDEIVGRPTSLMVPVSIQGPTRAVGATFCVFRKYSEVDPECRDIASRYWQKLRQMPVIPGIRLLSSINRLLSGHREGNPGVHHALNQRFVDPGIRAAVANPSVDPPGFACVFSRLSCLALMRHLLLYGNRSVDRKSVV